jgi:hypothetical protein
MKGLLKILFVFSALFFFGCGPSDLNVQYSKSADSLSGSVNAAIQQLKAVDTVLLKKAVNRYIYYYAFIEHTVSDTLLKPEADQLLRFMSAGKRLQDFEQNRLLLIQRGSLIATQLSNLAQDARQQKTSAGTLKNYYVNESLEASRLLKISQAQLSDYQSAWSDFKNALQPVEVLIRARNKGELPQVVQDSIIF